MMPAPRGPLSTKPHTAKQKPSTATSGHVSTGSRPAKTKPSAATKPSTGEVVPPPLSKHELRPMINKARRHARAFERNAGLWAVELRLHQHRRIVR
jgi:hypothetical protein